MLRKDYLMRQIEQFINIVLRIVGFKEAGKYEEAIMEVQKSTEDLLGLDWKVVEASTDAALITLLKSGGRIDEGKCIILAELLKELGEIYDLQLKPKQSRNAYIKSLSLFTEALPANEALRSPRHRDNLMFVVGKLESIELPDYLRQKLFRCYEAIGEFAEAENLLYEMVESGRKDILIEGKAFYRRLIEKEDGELERGNLPREEVEEGLSALERLLDR